MSYRLEKALPEHVSLLVDLINEHEQSVDPDFTPTGETDAMELLEGYFDPSIAAFLFADDSEQPIGFYSVNPDSNRNRFFTDIYARPGSEALKQVLAEALKASSQHEASYENWFGVNSKDQTMKALLESFGMHAFRTYWHLRHEVTDSSKQPIEFVGATIRNMSTEADFETYWTLHQDAFSQHFGFAPREKWQWIEMTKSAATFDPQACFLLELEGEPAGFVQLSTALEHMNAGFVDLIGVAHKFQGTGLGQLLLQHGINVCVERGNGFIELNVDSGNESGALRVYEKLGFKPQSSWEQYENKNWAELARTL